MPENREKLEKDQKIFEEIFPILNSDFSGKFKYVKSLDFESQNLSDILEVLQKYLRHLLMVKIGADKSGEKDAFFANYPVSKLKKIIKLTEDISFKTATSNASPKLALELLMLEI